MAQIGLDFETPLGGVRPGHDHCADVTGPGAGYVLPLMMARKFIGETTTKVVRLSDVYRIPPAVCGEVAENIDASNLVKCDFPKFEVFKLVRSHSPHTK